MTPIKTAVVGYGFSARTFHLPFIQHSSDFELVAISSRQAEQVAADWPGVQCFADAEAMFAESGAELVIITAPNRVHASLAQAALLADLHVVVEKPFVTRVADGEALLALAKARGRVLSVYHNRRWDGDFLTVQQLLADGTLGRVRHFESHFDRFRPALRERWRETDSDGGGLLFDLGPHLLDQALQLFGWPSALTASVETWREGSTLPDYFSITLHYPDKQAVLSASLFCAAPNRRFVIQGDAGTYVKAGLDPQEDALRAGGAPVGDDWGREAAEWAGQRYDAAGVQAVTTQAGDYRRYFSGLAASIRQGAPAPVCASSALGGIQLIELALVSSQRGERIALGAAPFCQ